MEEPRPFVFFGSTMTSEDKLERLKESLNMLHTQITEARTAITALAGALANLQVIDRRELTQEFLSMIIFLRPELKATTDMKKLEKWVAEIDGFANAVAFFLGVQITGGVAPPKPSQGS